jgi:hypothetical protein
MLFTNLNKKQNDSRKRISNNNKKKLKPDKSFLIADFLNTDDLKNNDNNQQHCETSEHKCDLCDLKNNIDFYDEDYIQKKLEEIYMENLLDENMLDKLQMQASTFYRYDQQNSKLKFYLQKKKNTKPMLA